MQVWTEESLGVGGMVFENEDVRVGRNYSDRSWSIINIALGFMADKLINNYALLDRQDSEMSKFSGG